MAEKLYFKRGRFVTETGEFTGGLLVEDGRIVELITGEPSIAADEVIDLREKTVLPGLVDDHVHFNEPGREHWEGYHTGSMAAAAGGVTTFIEMPLNATPPSIDRDKLLHKQAAVRDKAVVDYALWGGLVDNNLADLDGLHAEGVVAFKGFMSESGVDFARIDDDILYAGLLKSAELGNIVGVHAENEYVTRFLGEQLRAQGRTDRASWTQSRPPFAELEALRRAIYWAGVSGGHLHVVHTTIAAGIRAAHHARVNDGISVTVETCPHYLYFDDSDFERLGPLAKCAPPIRARAEVEALWECVLAGMVDTIASDHSPCPWSDKEPGMANIWRAWGGIAGVQSTLTVLLTEGVHKRGLPLTDLVRMTSANPARIFGLYPQKGSLLPGSDADFVVVDLDREWELAAGDLHQKHKFSPYVGSAIQGRGGAYHAARPDRLRERPNPGRTRLRPPVAPRRAGRPKTVTRWVWASPDPPMKDFQGVISMSVTTGPVDADVTTRNRAITKPGQYAILPRGARVLSTIPAFVNTSVQVMTTPALGARFTEYELLIQPGGGTRSPIQDDLEHFLFVIEGSVSFTLNGRDHAFTTGGFAWLPPGSRFALSNNSGALTRMLWLRRRYEPVEGVPVPDPIVSNEKDVEAMPEDTYVEKHLIPYDHELGFDMAFNLLIFKPGIYFSYVESHIMEHGLYMLDGRGVYYLNGDYIEVQKDDYIYMAPYVPQFFYATGWETGRYILYKDINRDYVAGL